MSTAYTGDGITFADGTNIASGNTGFVNKIINGAMVIDQRNAGASVTATSNPFTLDRWQAYGAPSAKYTIQQNAGSVTPPVGFSKYLGVTSSSAYTVTSGDYFFLTQHIEGSNVADLNFGSANAKTVTLSFWVYSSLTGSFGGSLANGAQNRSYPFTYTISAANTWTQIKITIAGDTTGTWATGNTSGLEVNLGLGVGSGLSGTATGAWQAGDYRSASGSVSVVGTSGATFYITGVQLEVGSSATGFEYRQYGQELALVQRYFYAELTYNMCNSTAANGNQYLTVKHPVSMRANPTYALQSGSWTTSNPTLDGSTVNTARLSSASDFYSNGTANISFSSEL